VIAFANQIEQTLRATGLNRRMCNGCAPSGNERILKAVSSGSDLLRSVCRDAGKYGNTSAASVSMALGWAAEEGIFHDGDKIVCCAVGAGSPTPAACSGVVIGRRGMKDADSRILGATATLAGDLAAY